MRRTAEQHVVQAGHLGRQMRILRYVCDQPGELAMTELPGWLATEHDATDRRDDARDRAQHGRLARAVRANQGNPLAGRDAHADAVERRGRTVTDPQIVDADHDESALARLDRSTNRKNGAPMAAVVTPIGTSVSGCTVLAAMSARTRNAAPPIIETGSSTR